MFIYVLQIKTHEESEWHDCDYPQYEPANMYFNEAEAIGILEWYKENLPEYDWRLEKRHYIMNYVYGAYPE